MLSIIIIVLTVILSFVLSLVSTKTPLYSIKKKSIAVHRSGWEALILIFLIAVLAIWQNWLNNNDLEKARQTSEKNARNSENRIRMDYAESVERITNNYDEKTGELKDEYTSNAIDLKNRYDTSTTNIIKALAKYGLSYNKRTNKLESLIRDSVRTRPDPTFDILYVKNHYENDIKKDFELHLVSKDAGCRNIDINISTLVSDNLEGPYTFCGNEHYKEGQFGANDERTKFMGIYKKIKYYNLVFFVVKGTYQNTDRTKIFPINVAVCFNLISGTTTSISGDTKEAINTYIGYYGY